MPIERRRRMPIFQQRRFQPRRNFQAQNRQAAQMRTTQRQGAFWARPAVRQPPGKMPEKKAGQRMVPAAMQMQEPRERFESTAPFTRPASSRAGWSAIPIFGPLIDLLRNLVFPQEQHREAKRLLPGSKTGMFAKTAAERAKARMQARMEQRQAMQAQRANPKQRA